MATKKHPTTKRATRFQQKAEELVHERDTARISELQREIRQIRKDRPRRVAEVAQGLRTWELVLLPLMRQEGAAAVRARVESDASVRSAGVGIVMLKALDGLEGRISDGEREDLMMAAVRAILADTTGMIGAKDILRAVSDKDPKGPAKRR